MADPAWTELGITVAATMLVALVAFSWVTNPRHTRTRRALALPVHLIIGLAIRVGLID